MKNRFLLGKSILRFNCWKQDRGNKANGCVPLSPGQYQANKTSDGALEILQGSSEPLYLLPFIWWERMEMGEIVIS